MSSQEKDGRPDADTVRRYLRRFQQQHDDRVRQGETCLPIGDNLAVALANFALSSLNKGRRDAS